MRTVSIFRCLPLCLALTALPAMSEPLNLNCRIEPFVEVDISSAVEGVLSDVLVEKNSQVNAGDVIARLESGLEAATVQLRKLQAELTSDITAQQLALEFAERSLDRVTDLQKKNAASAAELDKVTTEYALARQRLEQAKDRQRQSQLEHERAEQNLARYTITSPTAGVVVERFKEPGEHIDSEPVVRVAQLDPLRVKAYAPASLYGKIVPGTRATLTPELAQRSQSVALEVDRVDRTIDGPSNTFGIELIFPNPEQSVPSGLRCTLKFSGIEAP